MLLSFGLSNMFFKSFSVIFIYRDRCFTIPEYPSSVKKGQSRLVQASKSCLALIKSSGSAWLCLKLQNHHNQWWILVASPDNYESKANGDKQSKSKNLIRHLLGILWLLNRMPVHNIFPAENHNSKIFQHYLEFSILICFIKVNPLLSLIWKAVWCCVYEERMWQDTCTMFKSTPNFQSDKHINSRWYFWAKVRRCSFVCSVITQLTM